VTIYGDADFDSAYVYGTAGDDAHIVEDFVAAGAGISVTFSGLDI